MGIGIFLVWPLAKKFGKKNVTMVGFLIYAIGSAICWMAPTNLYMVLVGQFIKNIGGLPCAYVFMALFADALDGIEWKTGFRTDGVAMSIYSIITVAMVGICTGLFNLFLSKTGYIAPTTLEEYQANGYLFSGLTTQLSADQILALTDPKAAIAFIQEGGVNSFITFAFVGLEVITGLLCAGILLFVGVENTISKKHLVLIEREKAQYEKLGKKWLPADERNLLEIAKQEEEAEVAYKEELMARCEKKGLDFEQEYQKHLDEKQRIKEKNEAKAQIAKEREEAKEAKKKAKLTSEKQEKLALKKQRREEKIEAIWAIESERGEKEYEKYQEALAQYESREDIMRIS